MERGLSPVELLEERRDRFTASWGTTARRAAASACSRRGNDEQYARSDRTDVGADDRDFEVLG